MANCIFAGRTHCTFTTFGSSTAALFDWFDAYTDGFVSESELTALWKK